MVALVAGSVDVLKGLVLLCIVVSAGDGCSLRADGSDEQCYEEKAC